MAVLLLNQLIDEIENNINKHNVYGISVTMEDVEDVENDAKCIDVNHNLIPSETSINGYIRDVQTLLHHLIIPSTITYLIYAFYDLWFTLRVMPETLNLKYSLALFYQNKKTKKEYFIICPLYEDTRNIYIYDCLDDTWNILTRYPDHFDPVCHGAVINRIDEELFIFHGQTQIFGKYNLITNTWRIYCDSTHNQNQQKYNVVESSNPSAVFIATPLNEIHAMIPYRNQNRQRYHMKYSDRYKQFVTASINGINNNGILFGSAMVTVRVDNKPYIMMIGGYHDNVRGDEIWYCDATEINDCKWKLFPIKLPLRNYATVVVAFERVIVLLIGDINDNDEADAHYQLIYCLEIENFEDNNYNEWIRCNVKPPKTFRMSITDNNYIHFMNHYYPQQHEKIHISNVIPYKLYRKYQC